MLTDIVQYIFLHWVEWLFFSHIRPFRLGLSSAYPKDKKPKQSEIRTLGRGCPALSATHHTGLWPYQDKRYLPDIWQRECKADV